MIRATSSLEPSSKVDWSNSKWAQNELYSSASAAHIEKEVFDPFLSHWLSLNGLFPRLFRT